MVNIQRRYGKKTVSAVDVAMRILRDHPDYGGGGTTAAIRRLERLDPAALNISDATMAEWLDRAAAFFRPNTVITGRCVVAALALLSEPMATALLADGFLAALGTEVPPDGFPSVLTLVDENAAGFLNGLLNPNAEEDAPPSLSGSTETLSDAPAQSKSKDRLGRAAFAEVLAENVRRLRSLDKNAPLVVHLDGPWGSGKSTVLNFLEGALATGSAGRQAWTVLRYNAWQQQRVDSPWWAMTTLIAVEGQGQLRGKRWLAAIYMGLRHFWFRTFAGRVPILLAAMAAIVVGLVAYYLPVDRAPGGAAPQMLGRLKDIFSIATIIFGGVLAASRFLTATDATAKDFLRSRLDPVGALVRHMKFLLRTLGQPVAILVDDMDRCDADAVVRVLEGIHTVFGTLSIVFVVAGDGRWIARAFEKTYADNAPSPDRTALGRPLGSLFLEKIFQFSAVVPDMPQAIKARYWRELLNMSTASEVEDTAEDVRRIGRLRTEEEVLAIVAEVDPSKAPAKAQALREAAMHRLAQPDLIEKPSQHVLEVFGAIVEANPRAMKRQVMAYGMARACDLASYRNTPQRALAAWSVVCMRWPTLADWLREEPGRIANGSAGPGEADEGQDGKVFRAVMRQPEVKELLSELDTKTFRALLGK
jgi:hypothetical protein